MNDINIITFTGRLGSDPTLTFLPTGTAVAKINLAIGEKWTDKVTNQVRGQTSWIQCEMMGAMAEILAQNLRKGDPVMVTGRLKVQSWEKDGAKKERAFIAIQAFRKLDWSKPEQSGPRTVNHTAPQAEVLDEDGDDDVPF
jgi:single-strand DNA-binding protein